MLGKNIFMPNQKNQSRNTWRCCCNTVNCLYGTLSTSSVFFNIMMWYSNIVKWHSHIPAFPQLIEMKTKLVQHVESEWMRQWKSESVRVRHWESEIVWDSWANSVMWLCYFTMLLYHIIMLKKTLQVFNVPYKQSTVLQQHLQVSPL